MQELLYSEWLVLKALQTKTMTLQELFLETKLDRRLLSSVISNLVRMKKIHAARGLFRARVKVTEPLHYQNWGTSVVEMINETYRQSAC